MYIDTSKEAPLPDNNNQYSAKKPPRTREIVWRTVSEFKEKISQLSPALFVSNKEDKEDEECGRKRPKLNFTNSWDEDLTNHGYARCLRSACNFISNNMRAIKVHYRDCDGVPRYKGQNLCSICKNYLSSREAHAEHVPICTGFNKYNQKDYKYERGLRARKSVMKVPFDRLLDWQDEIITSGTANCGFKMCNFFSKSLADLERHRRTCTGTPIFKTKFCAHCHSKFATDADYFGHRPKCAGFKRMYGKNAKGGRTATATATATATTATATTATATTENVQQSPDAESEEEDEPEILTSRILHAWKWSLIVRKYVRCKCDFLAMSLEDMLRHFNHCKSDRKLAKVVCPFCKGRMFTKELLKKHIKRSHSLDSNTRGKGESLRDKILRNERTNRILAWLVQLSKFGQAFCMEVACGFIGATVEELEIHGLTCKEIAKKKLAMCGLCKNRVPVEQLAAHVLKCYSVLGGLMNLAGRGRRRVVTSPMERRNVRTDISRKRKNDDGLNNENPGGPRGRAGNSSGRKGGKKPKLALPERILEEQKSQVEASEEEDDDVQVIEDNDDEDEEMRKALIILNENNVEVAPVVAAEEEYDSDGSDVQIIDEIRRVDTDGDNQITFDTDEVVVIDSDSDEIEEGDMVEEEEEPERFESENEELLSVGSVEIVDNQLEELKREVAEIYQVDESLENELEGVKDFDAYILQNEELEGIDEIDHEEAVEDEEIDTEKDEAENVEAENGEEDAQESAVFNDSEDNEMEESEKDEDDGKDDEAEDEEDDLPADDEVEVSEKASNDGKQKAPESVSLNNSEDELEASEKASNEENENESDNEEEDLQPDDEMEASDKASNDGIDEEDDLEADDEMEASKKASNDGKETAAQSVSPNNSDDNQVEASKKALNEEKEDETEDEEDGSQADDEMEESEKDEDDEKDDESDDDDGAQADDEMEGSENDEESDNESGNEPENEPEDESRDEPNGESENEEDSLEPADKMEVSEKASSEEKEEESEDEVDNFQTDDEMEVSEKTSNDGKKDTPKSVSPNNSEDDEMEVSEKALIEEKQDKVDNSQADDKMEVSETVLNEEKEDESEIDVDSFGLDESENEPEDYRMEIDEGVMSTIFETLDDDFDKCNPPYSVVGNEIEFVDVSEISQSTLLKLPNEDSQCFLMNEDSGTLDRNEPPPTEGEQTFDNDQVGGDEGGDGGNDQDKSSQGVEETGGQDNEPAPDENNDDDLGKESDGGEDGRKEKDEDGDDGDDKKKENKKKGEEDEDDDNDNDNADDNEEDADDEDEDDGEKKGDTEMKETSEQRENMEQEEGNSKVQSGSEEKHEDELKESPKTEKAKAEKTRSPGKTEGSKETNKDKGKEARKPVRRSKRWSEDDGSEEYIPKGLNWGEQGSEDDGESIARSRGRRQSKPITEVKVTPIESPVKKTNEVKCGKCEFKGSRQAFNRHNLYTHYLLGWIEGEKEVDLNDEEKVKALLRAAFKVVKKAVCEVCKEAKRSYMGFLWHIQLCGKSEAEKEAFKVKCPVCSLKFNRFGIGTHLHRAHGGVSATETADDVSQGVDTGRVLRKEKAKTHRNVDGKGDYPTQKSGEPVVYSIKRKSALRAATKFQEAFKSSFEQDEEDEEEEKAKEPGYFLYEKGGKIPKLCCKLRNLWYTLRRNKEVIRCHHHNCSNTSADVKEATIHHFTCSLLPLKTYFCKSCDYYSVEESYVQTHVMSSHRKGKESKQNADMDFEDNEDMDVDDDEPVENVRSAEESWKESENDVEESDKRNRKQKPKKTNNKNKNKTKTKGSVKKVAKKRNDSDSDDNMTEGAHKQNFCEREKLDNVKGDEFYSKALDLTREFEEGNGEEEIEISEEEMEEEVDSETDNSGVWPELHTECDDWFGMAREVSSIHLPELLESISISFVKGDSKDYEWRRFKRFEGDIIDGVPAMFVGGSVRALSWCKVSFRRALERCVKQYLAVSTAKNIDHLTDVHRNREFSWSLVQIWDCGPLENAAPEQPPRFCLGIFQEGGEIWDIAWLPEDTYGRGSDGRLTRIGILATASDDGSIRIWSICEPSEVVSDTRYPLFITEPLVKLSIDNFLEDSCVRLSLGRDGMVAGGYVNGNLAVWNLNNMTSSFCGKIGKCVVIKPHLVIQAHRTSVTALTFCPNNNRYITSGGLDRIVKLWDLESPWVPVEQYQRELCLDNIWPKNWPMNIYNYDDGNSASRKGVVRFVKGVVSSKHSPCLILDNTCLSLSFSDWLNSLCGCNNTGEVKIRFLKNLLRDQDKKHEKYQSTLSSLRLEKLNGDDDSDWEAGPATSDGVRKALPKTYGMLNAQYGIVIKDHDLKDRGSPLADTFHPEDFPIRAVNKVAFNPNFKSFTHIAVGYNCGLVRIQRLNELQFNNAIKSFSDKAKNKRL